MTQKTIKALYKQPVNYKLTKDGYKTINGVIHAQDGMPKVVDLPVPSELYTTDLQYNVDTEINGAPIITTESFTLPDNEICEAKEYCYAPKGNTYDYRSKKEVEYSYINTASYTVVGSPTIDTTSGIITNFSNSNYLITGNSPSGTVNSYEVVLKFKTSSFDDGRLIGNYASNIHSIQVEVPNSNENKMWWGHPSSGYSWQAINPNYVIEPDTWYWVKGVYNSSTSKLIVYMHKENEDYINCGELDVTGCGWNEDIEIGCDQGGGGATGAYIDLSESYIKINGSYWWKPWIRETKIEEVITQIPGILDSSVTTDDWQQNQEYKLYQLKNQNNTDTLQLTENNITDTTQKYKQYINQLTIPARDYKWYYNGIPQSVYTNFYNQGATINNKIAVNFTGGPIMLYPLYHMVYDTSNICMFMNIETGNITQDCILLSFSRNLSESVTLPVFAIKNSKLALLSNTSPTDITYGSSTLTSYTKYWIALAVNFNTLVCDMYLITDNNYTNKTLPSISSWTKELTFEGDSPEMFYAELMLGFDVLNIGLNSFTGKVYLDNLWARNNLDSSYTQIVWQAYSYYNYIYYWMANKSLYNYNINEDYGNILDFSDSYVNVAQDQFYKYKNSEVFLMPINGGEIINYYSANGILSGTAYVDELTGIMSNCNPTNYLTLPEAFLPENNPWEINLKVKTPDTMDAMHYIMGSLNSYYWTVGGELSVNNTFGFGITSTGESWDIAWLAGNTVATSDTWYWIRLSFTGTEYKFELSTDGETYNLEASVANTTSIYQNSTNSIIHLGTQATHYTYWTGEIDLSQCNIKINNVIWWNGVNITQAHRYLKEVTKESVNYDNFANLPTTLIDNANFIISNNKITNGPTSYHVQSATSYGYFAFTPTETKTVSIKAYISSEDCCDWGACYIGTKIYRPTHDQILSQTTDGYGVYLFAIHGSTSETTYTYTLQAGTTYYINFYYTKDHSVDGGDDRLYITQLRGFVGTQVEIINLPGCLYNYNDEGQEHQFDVYYDANYTQPILVSTGETYSGGTKVDTITIPAHKTWNYQTGGNWLPITYVDTTTSNYTYEDGNLVLTEYTGNETDVILPNAVL
ncbi:MAG: hypothetical protein IKO49_02250 [Bacilli bacterium]|nr:hypothetical protein [Clostridia bacterium]MBR4618103.1 hypothetical protein [Bacilli bacterium]